MQDNQQNNELIENIAEQPPEETPRSSSKIFIFVLALHILVITAAVGFHMLRGGGGKSVQNQLTKNSNPSSVVNEGDTSARVEPRGNQVSSASPFFTVDESGNKSSLINTTPEAAARIEAEKIQNRATQEQTTPDPSLIAELPPPLDVPVHTEDLHKERLGSTQRNEIYIVRPGDTLSVIARRFGTTTSQIMRDNNKTNQKIVVGERLTILTTSDPELHDLLQKPNQAQNKVESVQRSAVIQRPTTRTQTENPARTETNASIVSSVPVPTASPLPQTVHTVTRGETLFSIARRYGVSVDQLRSWNSLASDRISVGQKLLIASSQAPVREQSSLARQENSQGGQIAQAKPTSSSVTPITSAVSTATISRIPAAEVVTHRVAAGDTLSSIARTYGTSVEQIKSDNELSSDFITIGQEIKIYPQSLPKSKSDFASERVVYEVRAGDTLSSIARAHGVSVQDLFDANNLQSPNIKIGQRLIIPRQSSAQTPNRHPGRTYGKPHEREQEVPTETEYYIVRPGDTLFKIALKHGLTVEALSKANGLVEGDVLRVGQQLMIPQKPITEVAKN